MYLLFGLLIILFLIYYLLTTKHTEPFANSSPSDLVPNLADSQRRFGSLGMMINTANPQLPLTSASASAIDSATATPTVSGGLPGQYSVSMPSPQQNPYKIPENPSATMKLTQVTCESIKTSDCSAFNDPKFAENCGISFDPNGTDSNGQPHIGGLYISPDDKQAQQQMQQAQNLTPDQIQYFPSIGKAAKGMFAVDSKTCEIIKEQLECKRTRSFSSPNCTQCLTSSDFVRVDPSIPRIPPALILQTNASSLSISSSSVSSVTITVPAPDMGFIVSATDISFNEGDLLYFSISGSAPNLYISGFISGQTVKGQFNMDINALIDQDLVTGYKQRLAGAQTITAGPPDGGGGNNASIQCMIIRPGIGQTTMKLRMHVPFSFLSPYEYDATYCDNGPFLTMQSSADFLSSDVCYGPKNGPGTYQLDCLQQMFLSLGGTIAGTGYPQTISSAAAQQLLVDSGGNPRQLADISNYIYGFALQASTGRDSNGNDLTVADWNTASMYITGTPIVNPCGPSGGAGGVTKECVQFLYDGAIASGPGASRSSIQPTYSLGPQYASKDSTGNLVYCTAGGGLSPGTAGGLAKAMAIGTVAGIQQLYDTAHKTANDNTKTNNERQQAMLDCYGEVIGQKMPEVYYVGDLHGGMNFGPVSYVYNIGDGATAEQVCSTYGGRVATGEEVQEAQLAGAQWCSTGIVSDNNYQTAIFPMQDAVTTGCGTPGINTFIPQNGQVGINCFGPKPAQITTEATNVLPFFTPVQPNIITKPSPYAGQIIWNEPY